MESIRKECAEFKKQKYQPVVFISGNESLEECLYHLMKHNIELMVTHPERFKGSANWAKPNTEIKGENECIEKSKLTNSENARKYRLF